MLLQAGQNATATIDQDVMAVDLQQIAGGGGSGGRECARSAENGQFHGIASLGLLCDKVLWISISTRVKDAAF